MQTFQTPGPLYLRLHVPAGEIEIETVDGTQTSVDLVALRQDEFTEAALAEARVELRERGGGGQELRVEIPERGATGRFGFLFSRSPEVLVRIACPHGASIQSKSKSADLEARGRFGDVIIETTSGDVELGDVERSARVNSVSGDVRLARVAGSCELNAVSGDLFADVVLGPANLNTVSGDVVLRDAGSSANANTVSGDIRLEAVETGEVSANSVSGDVHIGVRRGTKVWIDVGSRSGDITSQLDVQDARPDGGGDIVELRVQTLSGDVQLARAAARDRAPSANELAH